MLLLPAETANVIPDAIAFCTARSSDGDAPPPRLMLATAGFTALTTIQSSADTIPDV